MTVDLQINDCSEGDILAADIFNRSGVKLAACDTTMNEFIINKLAQLGVEKVLVYDPPICADKKNYRQKCFASNYKESVVSVKGIVTDLAAGKRLNYEKVVDTSELIYKHVNDDNNEYIIRCLDGIKKSDEYTYLHSVNTAFYCMLIAKWIGMSEKDIKRAIQAGFLHDIGKARIPPEVLNKRTPLTKEEFAVIKKHPVLGYYTLDESNFTDIDIKRAVLLHHERVNRTGYPFSISASCIGTITRIVSVSDVYDAMTSDRVYKKKASPFAAFEMFMTDGITNFDSNIVNTFISHMSTYFIGSEAVLSNGEQGQIVYVPPQDPLSPIVLSNGDYIPINENHLRISEIINSPTVA